MPGVSWAVIQVRLPLVTVASDAGLLDGRKATTNRRAFSWVRSQSDQVDWIENVRWVLVSTPLLGMLSAAMFAIA